MNPWKRHKEQQKIFDQRVLRLVKKWGIGPHGVYGVPLHEAIERMQGGFVSIGKLYSSLERLEKQGLVTSWLGDATPNRGNRMKKFFKAVEVVKGGGAGD